MFYVPNIRDNFLLLFFITFKMTLFEYRMTFVRKIADLLKKRGKFSFRTSNCMTQLLAMQSWIYELGRVPRYVWQATETRVSYPKIPMRLTHRLGNFLRNWDRTLQGNRWDDSSDFWCMLGEHRDPKLCTSHNYNIHLLLLDKNLIWTLFFFISFRFLIRCELNKRRAESENYTTVDREWIKYFETSNLLKRNTNE